MTSQNNEIEKVIMCEDDLSSVYRKPSRYEKGYAAGMVNVYHDSSLSSDVLCVLMENDEFEIDHEDSRRDFYKIYTASGVEGFVKKSRVKTGG